MGLMRVSCFGFKIGKMLWFWSIEFSGTREQGIV